MAKPAQTHVLRAVTLRRIITNATKPAKKVARTALTCSAWLDVAPVPVSTDVMVAPAIRADEIAGRTASEQKLVARTPARRGRSGLTLANLLSNIPPSVRCPTLPDHRPTLFCFRQLTSSRKGGADERLRVRLGIPERTAPQRCHLALHPAKSYRLFLVPGEGADVPLSTHFEAVGQRSRRQFRHLG